jgi:hypothetical protein
MLQVREGHNDRSGVFDMSYVQVIRCDMCEDNVKLYNTSLFNYAVSMSISKVEWCSNDTSKEKMVTYFELLYWNFPELIEEKYKIPHSD